MPPQGEISHASSPNLKDRPLASASSSSSLSSSGDGSLLPSRTSQGSSSFDRFNRQADTVASVEDACIITIDGQVLDVSSWAKAHPGGVRVLQKYHGRDASRAFGAAGHSDEARALLQTFVVANSAPERKLGADSTSKWGHRWKKKLFTHEDRYGIHKTLGIFCLGNYLYRFTLMIFGDPTAGMGSNHQSLLPVLSLIPHALLSLSSLLFHTVPRERVVGKPMIWQEFRVHNIIFGLRSLVCSAVAWCSIHSFQTNSEKPILDRRLAVWISGISVLAACQGADVATARLRHRSEESTTATMPYWNGCSPGTEKLFKHFYALSQFGATIGCLMVSNPVWPLAILLPIQGASLLMTLVRKGLISTHSYHMAYLASLLLVFVVGIRHLFLMWTLDLVALFVTALLAYQLRRLGVSKYTLWVPLVAVRIAVGEKYLNWQFW